MAFVDDYQQQYNYDFTQLFNSSVPRIFYPPTSVSLTNETLGIPALDKKALLGQKGENSSRLEVSTTRSGPG